MITAYLALVGLVMGSFIDALLFRIFAQESELSKSAQKNAKKKVGEKDLSIMTGRSMCETCHTALQPKDLIPVLSWLSTGGKCRYCKVKLSWQSPVIEVLMSIVFVVVYRLLPREMTDDNQAWIMLGAWLVYSVGLVAMAVYDLRHLIIPNRIILPLIGLGAAHTLVEALAFGGGAERIKEAVLGLAVGGGLFYVLFMVSSGRWIGGGDVKIGFFLGIVLGPIKALIALWMSFNVALIVILPLMIVGVVKRKQHVPFGPFLIAATLFAAIWGQQVADWYNQQFLYGIF